MAEIQWGLLQPVNTGALVQQGFGTGMALVKQIQTKNALRSYLANPDDPTAYNALATYDPQTASVLQQRRLIQQKTDREAQEQALSRSIGAQAASGDTAGARKSALESGNFDLAKQFDDLDETGRKRTADFWDKAGSVAFRLRGLKSNEERAAYWTEARSILEQEGAPTDLLDKFDPNNPAQLDAAIATAQKVGELYTQTKPQEFNVGPGEGRYERDPITGDVRTIIAPNPGTENFGDAVDNPRANGSTIEANNNPGALRVPGSKQFQRFATTEEGIRAQHAQLNRYLGRGLNTVGSIIEKYAPREKNGGDNTDAQVDNYISYVSERAGLAPGQQISAAQIPTVAKAMREFETGHKERLAGAHDAGAIRAAANRAIVSGADPEKVRARARQQGVEL